MLPKHAIILNFAALNALHTYANLMKRGFFGPNCCSLCFNHEESASHLFFSCTYSQEVISSVKVWASIHHTSNNLKCLLWILRRHFKGDSWLRKKAKASVAAAVYMIWAERNSRIFEGKFSQPKAIIQKAQYYHYLFDAAIKLNQLGLDWSSPNHGPFKSIQGVSRINKNRAGSAKASTSELNPGEPVRRCIVLDIEGTTTPISFVTDVLFPYARANVGRHLSSTYATLETQDFIKLLHIQIQDDLENGVVGAIPVPSNNEGKEEVISALVANVEAMIKADRKITALKQLQGHIWRTGFQNGELEGIVFEDVPEAFERWTASGTKVYIYSSGSQLAQRLIFGNTKYGDLRKYLCGFFDTAVGNKREMSSYVEISESVGLDDSSEILFLTDVYQEATAAKAAGLEVIVSVRPGNGPLPDNHGLKTVNSFSEI